MIARPTIPAAAIVLASAVVLVAPGCEREASGLEVAWAVSPERGKGARWRPTDEDAQLFTSRLRDAYFAIEPASFPKHDATISATTASWQVVLHPVEPNNTTSYSASGFIAWSVARDREYIRDLAAAILRDYAIHLERVGFDVDPDAYMPDYAPPRYK